MFCNILEVDTLSYTLSAILGLIQGLTEFLPVSSSGHLVIFQSFFGMADYESQYMLLDVLLHLGTLIAVLIVFFMDVLCLIYSFFTVLKKLFTGKFKWSLLAPYERLVIAVIVGTLPLLLVIPFKSKIETAFTSPLFVGICLVVTSMLLLIGSRCPKDTIGVKHQSKSSALIVGIFQLVAILPGISRSGSTLVAGLLCGYSKEFAIKFAFLLSLPAVLGANIFTLHEALGQGIDSASLPVFGVGMLVAAVSGIAAIKILQWFLKKDKLIFFSIYCFVVGVGTITASILLK